jgi:hypothetical protein
MAPQPSPWGEVGAKAARLVIPDAPKGVEPRSIHINHRFKAVPSRSGNRPRHSLRLFVAARVEKVRP